MGNKYIEKAADILDWNKLRFLSCVIVLCSVAYHGYFQIKEHRCYESLFSQYANENSSASKCVLKKYSPTEAKLCLQKYPKDRKNKTVIFIGDSFTKSFYLSFEREVISGKVEKDNQQRITDPDSRNLVNFVSMATPQSDLKKVLLEINTKSRIPSIAILGFAYPNPKVLDDNETDVMLKSISSFSFDLDLLSQEIPTIWIFPYVKSTKEDTFFVNYIKNVKQILKGTHVRIWDMSSISRKSIPKTQVMLNLLCNKHQKDSELLCCSSSYQKDNSIAYIFITLLILSLIILFVGNYYSSNLLEITERKMGSTTTYLKKLFVWSSRSKVGQELPVSTINLPDSQCTSISILILKSTLIFGYFYLCDRTDFFTKTKKSFGLLEFTLPIVFCFIIGIAFRSKASSDKMLNREITDEWKGWMQLIILVYHVTGASSILPIYINIRILVSSYLFMTGFGNVCYYWQGGAMTFRRYCQVMLRMNLLTIVLCVVMQRSYQFYYFVPLVSFWYSIIYGLLLLPPKLSVSVDTSKVKPSNNDYACLLLKFVILFVVIALISNYKKAFEYFFNFPLWNFLFVLPGDGDHEWWFRWQLDRFSILYGSIFALLYQFMLPSMVQEEKLPNDRLSLKTVLKCAFGLGMVCSYSSILLFCRTKQECNFTHPFVVSIPILGYILLRNASTSYRGIYSKFFTAAGKISLELFICQYHVWLAADTKGRLVLAPGIPLLNLTVVSFVFTSIAYEVHEITGHVTHLIIAKDNGKIVNNLIVLFTIVAVCKFFIF